MIQAFTEPAHGRRASSRLLLLLFLTGLSLVLWTGTAFAHAVAEGDKGYIQEISGVHLLEFMYLGAKHMVTGYDHILFLFGIIFFLYRMKHIAYLCQPVRDRPFDDHAAGRFLRLRHQQLYY